MLPIWFRVLKNVACFKKYAYNEIKLSKVIYLYVDFKVGEKVYL